MKRRRERSRVVSRMDEHVASGELVPDVLGIVREALIDAMYQGGGSYSTVHLAI